MKKNCNFLLISALVVFSGLFFWNLVDAQVKNDTGNISTLEINYPELSVDKISISGTKFSAGDIIKLKFNLWNYSRFDSPETYYTISLLKKDKEGGATDRYGLITKGKFYLSAGQRINLSSDYKVPDFAGGDGDYFLAVQTYTTGDYKSTWFFRPISLKIGTMPLKITTADVYANGQFFSLQDGPTIDNSGKLEFIAQGVFSNKTDMPAKVQIDYEASSVKKISESISLPINLRYGLNKINVPIDVKKLEQGVYVAKVNILDSENRNVSSEMSFRFIMGSGFVTVSAIDSDKDRVLKNESFVLSVGLFGPPGDLINNTFPEIGFVDVKVSVKNDKDVVVAEDTKQVEILDEAKVSFILISKADLENINVEVQVLKDGKVIGFRSANLTNPKAEPLKKNKNSLIFYIIFIVIVLGGISWVIYWFIRKKMLSKTNYLGPLIFVLILSGLSFVLNFQNVSAQITDVQAKCLELNSDLKNDLGDMTTVNWYGEYGNKFSDRDKSRTAAPKITFSEPSLGQAMITGGTYNVAYVADYKYCSNTGYNWSFRAFGQKYFSGWLDLFDILKTGPNEQRQGGHSSSDGQVSGIYEYNKIVPDEPFAVFGCGGFKYDRGNGESGISVSNKARIFDPLTTATCVPDKTNVFPGETVKWTVTTDKKTGTYYMKWCDGENCSSSCPTDNTPTAPNVDNGNGVWGVTVTKVCENVSREPLFGSSAPSCETGSPYFNPPPADRNTPDPCWIWQPTNVDEYGDPVDENDGQWENFCSNPCSGYDNTDYNFSTVCRDEYTYYLITPPETGSPVPPTAASSTPYTYSAVSKDRTEDSFEISYDTGGVKNMTVTISTEDCGGDEMVVTCEPSVFVDPNPLMVSCTPDAYTIGAGGSIIYTASTTGGLPPYSYSWNSEIIKEDGTVVPNPINGDGINTPPVQHDVVGTASTSVVVTALSGSGLSQEATASCYPNVVVTPCQSGYKLCGPACIPEGNCCALDGEIDCGTQCIVPGSATGESCCDSGTVVGTLNENLVCTPPTCPGGNCDTDTNGSFQFKITPSIVNRDQQTGLATCSLVVDTTTTTNCSIYKGTQLVNPIPINFNGLLNSTTSLEISTTTKFTVKCGTPGTALDATCFVNPNYKEI